MKLGQPLREAQRSTPRHGRERDEHSRTLLLEPVELPLHLVRLWLHEAWLRSWQLGRELIAAAPEPHERDLDPGHGYEHASAGLLPVTRGREHGSAR